MGSSSSHLPAVIKPQRHSHTEGQQRLCYAHASGGLKQLSPSSCDQAPPAQTPFRAVAIGYCKWGTQTALTFQL
eukprot:1160543-Pelagomonas_calceolata.AAC.6